MSRRALSLIEHLAEFNFACSVRLAGRLDLRELRAALAGVQRRHPALRALIRPHKGVLYYEPDAAPEIPLRVLPLAHGEAYGRAWERELGTAFGHESPQLRVVYFENDGECELLFTTSHRIADGLSTFIIVKDVLRLLAGGVALKPYEEIQVATLAARYRPALPWLTSVSLTLLNTCLRFLPSARSVPRKRESWTEWSLGPAASAALRQRCKAEGVSVHAAFLVALDRAMLTVLGARTPKWITCPIDLRRGRFPALQDDMLFYGGGNIRVRTGRWIEGDFWDSARRLRREIRAQVACEVLRISRRLFWFGRLRPLRCGQANWLVRAVESSAPWRRLRGIGISNLGNIEFNPADCPLPVSQIRLTARSLMFGTLGVIPYTINGEMRFYGMSSENFIPGSELLALQQEFTRTLAARSRPTACAEAVPA